MKILVVCTGNTCRSPMAEGVIKKLLEDRNLENITVESAGVAAFDGDTPTRHAVQAVRELGIDISGKRSRRIMMQGLSEADYFYVMTDSHKETLLRAMPDLDDRVTVLDIPDPFGQDLDTYRACRDRLVDFFRNELPKWLGETDGK